MLILDAAVNLQILPELYWLRKVGDVLEESARIALSWIRAHTAELGLPSAGAGAASDNGAGQDAQTRKTVTNPSCWDVHGESPAPAYTQSSMRHLWHGSLRA